jgi:acetylornithine deacetylase/succinyl-diaminopimelate desuccinylase-like protein
MSGGSRVNVVAERAEMEIEARFGTIKEAERIEGLMGNLQPFDERVRLTVKGGVNVRRWSARPMCAAISASARDCFATRI